MQLPGRLSSSTLGDLLGALHREGVTGLLELSEVRGPRGLSVPGRIHRVHLRGGLVVGVDTALPVPRIGEILRRDRLVHPEVVRRLVLAIDAGDRRAAGEILVGEGLAAVDAIRAALATQIRERLDALFTIEDAAITFRTARPLAHAVRPPALLPREFLYGRPRARDRRREETPPPPRTQPREETPPPRSGVRPVVEDPRDRARRLLGLSSDADQGEVRRAFRKLASAIHPDRLGGGSPEEQRRREARFAELSAAYHLLVA